MASIQNVPILKFDFDGNLDSTLKFQIDTDASVYGACTGQWGNGDSDVGDIVMLVTQSW